MGKASRRMLLPPHLPITRQQQYVTSVGSRIIIIFFFFLSFGFYAFNGFWLCVCCGVCVCGGGGRGVGVGCEGVWVEVL